jgi:hypothetical protein
VAHDPQGDGGSTADALSAEVANTESNLVNWVDWHRGHCGTVSERTSISNSWLQAVQAYS